MGNRKCFKPVRCGGQQNLASSAECEAVRRSGGLAVRRSPRHSSRPLGAATGGGKLRAPNEMCTIKDAISH